MVTAVAYYRTSSATNVGEDKDSEKRQRDACAAYAEREGIEIVHEYYDAAVRGSDAIGDRPGFSEMFSYMMGNGARIILIENASRFARDVVIQITGYEMLKKYGIELVAVDCPYHFQEDTPTAKLIRTVLGGVAEFQKDALVETMRKARDRKRRENGRCEGRKPALPGAIELANRLRGEGKTLRAISAELDKAGYRVMERVGTTNEYRPTDRPYLPQSVKKMLWS